MRRRRREPRRTEVLGSAVAGLARRRALRQPLRRRGQRRADPLRRRDVLVAHGRTGAEAVGQAWWRAAAHRRALRHAHGGGALRDRGARQAQQLRRHGLLLGDDAVGLGLGGQHALRGVAVALALAVLLVGVLDADVLVHEVLAVHVRDGVIGGLEVGVGHEAVVLREAVLGVARDLGRGDERAEAREGVVEGLFVDERVEVADEEVGAYFDRLLLVG